MYVFWKFFNFISIISSNIYGLQKLVILKPNQKPSLSMKSSINRRHWKIFHKTKDKIVLTKEIEKIFIEKGNQNFPVKHNISTTTAYKEKWNNKK